jgi:hypothetical protein
MGDNNIYGFVKKFRIKSTKNIENINILFSIFATIVNKIVP